MTKQDIENGMILETRDGERYMAIWSEGELYAVGTDLWMPLDTHKNDLTYNMETLDIMNIYRPSFGDFTNMMKATKPIWERKMPKKMTLEEICKELGYEVELV